VSEKLDDAETDEAPTKKSAKRAKSAKGKGSNKEASA